MSELSELSDRVAALELAQRRTDAYQQIQNVMGRYSFWHSANMHRETLDLFAMRTPGVRAEMMWGVYDGPESLERLYPGYHVWTDGDAKGKMHMHTLTTPVIEVSADATTAKAVWVSPGHETMSFTPGAEDEANWAWCKYGCDFVIEDGEWKIWHLHVFGLFLSPYNTSWADMDLSELPPPIVPSEYEPDREPTAPGWMYHKDAVYENRPAPPFPFTTFDDSTAF